MGRFRRLWIPLLLVLALAAGGCIWYVSDYYHADESALALLEGTEAVAVSDSGSGLLLDGPGQDRAVIFYPGAKVEHTSYLPLLCSLAEQGVDVFLVRMPFRLAVFGQNRAGEILSGYSYDHWFLAGHSLGGAMAAGWAAHHTGQLDGLILLASYPTQALRGENFSVLSIYGSEDGVLNRDRLEEGHALMPDHFREVVVEGGNHAQFGAYGPQKGDGEATISREAQQEQTVAAILSWMDQAAASSAGS